MKRVLILGSKGLLGSALKDKFQTQYEVVGLGHGDIDIVNEKDLAKKIDSAEPDVIINAAALNRVDLIEGDAKVYNLAQKINGQAIGALAKCCEKFGVLLVHFSSDYVFDGSLNEGYYEDALPNPINKYGVTKALGEKLLQDNTDQFYIVRISRLFGPCGTGSASKKSFVDLFIDLVEKENKTIIPLVDAEMDSPTYSLDAAQFVCNLVNDNKPFGIYHGANSGSCTWYELGKKISELKKYSITVKPVPSAEYPRAAKRPLSSILLNTKMPKQRPWLEALSDYLR